MPIDIKCITREEVDRLVASPPSPSLHYAAAGSGGASSPTQTLIVSLPSVATNEVEEISLLSVASSLPAESLPTVAADPMVASVSLLNTASTAAIQAPAAIANLQFATVATTSSSARTPSNGGPRSFAVSDSLANSCNTETRINNHNNDENDKESTRLFNTIDGLAETSSSSEADSSESGRSNKKSRKGSRPTSDSRQFKRREISQEADVSESQFKPRINLQKWQQLGKTAAVLPFGPTHVVLLTKTTSTLYDRGRFAL